MTGPEHYREAERLLAVCVGDRGSELDAVCTAAAQVHATLALAAATALTSHSADGSEYALDILAWHETAGTKPIGKEVHGGEH